MGAPQVNGGTDPETLSKLLAENNARSQAALEAERQRARVDEAALREADRIEREQIAAAEAAKVAKARADELATINELNAQTEAQSNPNGVNLDFAEALSIGVKKSKEPNNTVEPRAD